MKSARKTNTQENSTPNTNDPIQNYEFLNKTSKATKKIIATISKSFDPQKLYNEFNMNNEIDESKLMAYQSKLPQLIELISFKVFE